MTQDLTIVTKVEYTNFYLKREKGHKLIRKYSLLTIPGKYLSLKILC